MMMTNTRWLFIL